MATLRVMTAGNILRGVGLPDMSGDGFILGLTKPTMANSGVPAGTTLTTYDPTGLVRTINVDTPGTTFDSVDFGNVRVVVRTTGVTFRKCRWIITDNRTTSPMISTNSTSALNVLVEQCTIDNRDQMGYNFNGIEGHDVLVFRCKITGTCDGIRASLGGNVKIRGNFIGFMGWWGTYSGGPALNSEFQTHSDCIQTNWPNGLEVIGNSLWAYASETVGTGTPGSGTDTGNTSGWYTQAAAEARRAEALGSVMTTASKSADGVSHGVGGVLCCLMVTYAQGPTAPNITATDNWFAGGSVQVNGLADNIDSPLGTFLRNRHYNDSANTVAGKAIGYRVRADLTATIPTTGPDVNVYMDGSGVVPRI
jgi:hypothetical protein